MILVTGAGGYIGGKVASQLSGLGHTVAAMVRNGGASRPRADSLAAVREADYDDPRALEAAFSGIDDLVLISSDGHADDVVRHHANAIDAAGAAGVGRIVFTSIVDIGASSPFYFAPVYRDAERRLSTSSIPTTIVRCGIYSDFILKNWLLPAKMTGELALPAPDGPVAPISRDDVASAIVKAISLPRSAFDVVSVTGLGLTLGDAVCDYSERTGQAIRYRTCTLEEYKTQVVAHLDDPWPQAFATLAMSIAEGRFASASSDFARMTGRDPETFQSFIARQLL